jgi:DNA-binding XRE family transcriptional regulator
MNNKHLGSTWADYEREARERGVLTPEREAIIKAETDILSALIDARKVNKISQRELERLTGVQKSTIGRIEIGQNSATVETLLKILIPLGKTLAVVPIEQRGTANL